MFELSDSHLMVLGVSKFTLEDLLITSLKSMPFSY